VGGYEIVVPLGEGGMGEVYRARDLTLNRDVAIKVVNPRYCQQNDSRARLRREARALAALSHPNVASVHEFGESDSGCYIVMEYVPGQTLADLFGRTRQGSITDALRLCAQVAAAIEAAHDQGVIHRDLKPANVKVTETGHVKVLDFGLARQDAATPQESLDTASVAATEAGMILGTPAYMSPEQALGRTVDRRADIWAFGCLLFEALSRQRPFFRPTASESIAAILEREPDWTRLPADTPPAIRRLLRRCLQKDVTRRMRDIGDARLEIEEALDGPVTDVPVPRERRGVALLAVGAAALGALAGAALVMVLRTSPIEKPAPPARFVVPFPAGTTMAQTDFPALAISPDGDVVVYSATRADRTQLFVRRLDGNDPSAIEGSTNAVSPFFSPDGKWIAFFANGQLKKAPVSGGPPTAICDAATGFGGAWGRDDSIVFAPAPGSALFRVAASGGTPVRATSLNASAGEFSHRWPQLLENGHGVLFTVGTQGSFDDASVVAESLDGRKRTTVVKGGTNPRFLPSGYVLYGRDGALWAIPFDDATFTVSGAPFKVLDDLLVSSDGAAQFAVSANGTLAYVAGGMAASARRLLAVDERAAVTPLAAPARAYSAPRMSPDGRQIAVTIAGAVEDVWIFEIASGQLHQLTSDSVNRSPIWNPDGQRVTFSSNRAGPLNLFEAPVNGSATAERLNVSDNLQFPGSWSADGSVLAFVEHHPVTGRDIWTLRREGRQTAPVVVSPYDDTAPALSPDGRWLAYVSNRTGAAGVYVRSLADAASERLLSANGGSEPVWSRDGRQVYYREGSRLVGVPVTLGTRLQTGPARTVFSGSFAAGTADRANFDVALGTDRFVMVEDSGGPSSATELHVLLNWKMPSAAR